MSGEWRNEVRVKEGHGGVGLGSAGVKLLVPRVLAASGVRRLRCWRVRAVTMLEVS